MKFGYLGFKKVCQIKSFVFFAATVYIPIQLLGELSLVKLNSFFLYQFDGWGIFPIQLFPTRVYISDAKNCKFNNVMNYSDSFWIIWWFCSELTVHTVNPKLQDTAST